MSLVGDLTEGELLDVLLPILGSGARDGDGAADHDGQATPDRAHVDEIGPGDDAALVHMPRGTLVTVDGLVEGQDFVWAWPCGREQDPADAGWKSIAQNVSDINAMGGEPRHVFWSLQCPADTPLARIEGFARGMRAALDELAPGCRVSGGDLGTASELTSTVTVLGEPGPSGAVSRSGARPGDVVAVAGRLGWAAAGLALLLGDAPVTADAEPFVQAQFRPRPPMGAWRESAPTSLMDVSDGLGRDAHRLARASGVRLELSGAPLRARADELLPAVRALRSAPVRQDVGTGAAPASPGVASGHSDDDAGAALRLVLTGGEDFALLGTFPDAASVPDGFEVIGRVAGVGPNAATGAADRVLLDGAPLPAAGWDHFAGR
ncbi:thiamine-phosphate kinase [Falsarthrobacter nasiphocae]|uniref:Thiamine-monophosphate kinase n=1 Tax=Falsarthrobacter nasiphocae TaxID=189863 RepID=A0AAE3YGK8_9MICC|nr:thiamine-phosphate kinase [Falsarthrobacter nasiphocae]MDR6892830.1 thiamine-monophosphate kinase [Falsarthrobacter nasiphocae]